MNDSTQPNTKTAAHIDAHPAPIQPVSALSEYDLLRTLRQIVRLAGQVTEAGDWSPLWIDRLLYRFGFGRSPRHHVAARWGALTAFAGVLASTVNWLPIQQAPAAQAILIAAAAFAGLAVRGAILLLGSASLSYEYAIESLLVRYAPFAASREAANDLIQEIYSSRSFDFQDILSWAEDELSRREVDAFRSNYLSHASVVDVNLNKN